MPRTDAATQEQLARIQVLTRQAGLGSLQFPWDQDHPRETPGERTRQIYSRRGHPGTQRQNSQGCWSTFKGKGLRGRLNARPAG